jgi:coproporphyrinogen III oxidase-like Fe-S oxidoreductase
VRDAVDHQRFLCAYERELEFFAAKIPNRKITTIFFGGGTPSLMPIFLVEGILKKISALWQVDENCEISLEANPTSSEGAKFKALRDVGINRLSMGIQALNDNDLKFLGREHSSAEAISTIEIAAKIFDNFSFDLIYARPKQRLEDWADELKRAINFGTKHLSLYQLTIEKGTKFFSEFQQKKFIMPDENLSADFYDMTNQITADAGLELYEISNYAISPQPSSLAQSAEDLVSLELYSQTHEILGQRPRMTAVNEIKDYRCKHNLVYWQGGDYLGIGAGAHSRVYLEDELRSAIIMLHEPMSWLKKVEESGAGIQKIEKVSQEELLEELILMGLRLREGISENVFAKTFSEIFNQQKLEKLIGQGLIVFEKNQIKIPDSKRILTNSIIQKVCEAINDR